ncbi:hypothetical protein LINGRAHAP2_LOCUS30907, partial [Linum grandiflorum]
GTKGWLGTAAARWRTKSRRKPRCSWNGRREEENSRRGASSEEWLSPPLIAARREADVASVKEKKPGAMEADFGDRGVRWRSAATHRARLRRRMTRGGSPEVRGANHGIWWLKVKIARRLGPVRF